MQIQLDIAKDGNKKYKKEMSLILFHNTFLFNSVNIYNFL